MLIIRLTRRGRRNDPSFKLVVTEKSNPVKGKFLEELGFLNPKTKVKAFKKERILYWISKGAKCSPTVNNLLVSGKIIEGKKVKAWRPKTSSSGAKKKEGEEAVKSEMPKVEESKPEEVAIESSAPEQESAQEIKAEPAAPEQNQAPEQPQA